MPSCPGGGASASGSSEVGGLVGNEPIDQISRIVGDLNQMAKNMGTELKMQGQQLDALTQATEDNSDHMAKNTRKARALAGGKATDVQQFMPDKLPADAAKAAGRKAALAGMKSKYG